MFGNPFKIDKRMMVDEADIDFIGSTSKSPKRPLTPTETLISRPNKRKAGPLPKDYTFKRPLYNTSPADNTLPHTSTFNTNHLYTPSSPATMGAGYSNTPSPSPTPPQPLLHPIGSGFLPLSVPLPTSPPTSPVTTQAPLTPIAWTLPGIIYNPITIPAIPISPIHVGSTLQDAVAICGGISDSLNSVPEPSLQDTGGTHDFRLLNGDSKPRMETRARSPSPTLAYGPSSFEISYHPPTYSNHTSSSNQNEEKNISMILHEVNSNNHYSISNNEHSPRNNKVNNGPVVEEKDLSKQELNEIRRHNLNVRALVYKEVRKPGKNFMLLFNHLETIKGGSDIRIPFLKEIIKESLRFKRKTLASLLEEFVKGLQNNGNGVSTNNINSYLGRNTV